MFRETSIILLFIWKITQVQCQVDCEWVRTCQQCIQAPSCGWYLQYRSANGSGCFKNTNLDQLNSRDGYFHPPKATFYTVRNDNAAISPQEVALNCRLNEPFTFPVTYTRQRETWGKSVQLRPKIKKAGAVELTFFSNCSNHELIETNRCDNVELGGSVEFVVKVEQVQCSKRQPERIRVIEINPFPSPAIFRLNLYAYCHCPCEMEGRRGNPEPPEVIPDCHNRGRFTCGICYCNEGYAGKNCEINTKNTIEY